MLFVADLIVCLYDTERKVIKMTKENKIRPIAVAIIKNANKILAMKCFDCKKQEDFYRLLGGGVEFGEKAQNALIREFKEELDVNVKINSLIDVVENIFEFEGNLGHEVCFVYEAELVNKELYNQATIQMIEPEHKDTLVCWIEPTDDKKIYPLHPKNLK